jgi:hypothetical protein
LRGAHTRLGAHRRAGARDLPPAIDWLADQYLGAAELTGADTAAFAQMLAMQEGAAR